MIYFAVGLFYLVMGCLKLYKKNYDGSALWFGLFFMNLTFILRQAILAEKNKNE